MREGDAPADERQRAHREQRRGPHARPRPRVDDRRGCEERERDERAREVLAARRAGLERDERVGDDVDRDDAERTEDQPPLATARPMIGAVVVASVMPRR